MDINILKTFLAIVQEGNISKASAVLHISQPTLSRQINQLEEELGVMLFERGKNIVLTDAGHLLLHRAEEIVQLDRKTEEEIRNISDVVGVITLGVGAQFNVSGVPEAIIKFCEQYPDVRFELVSGDSHDVKARIDNGTIDFGIILNMPADIGYEYIDLLHQQRWGMLVGRNNPLFEAEYIEPKDIGNNPVMISTRRDIVRMIEIWAGTYRKKMNVIMQFNSVQNVTPFVEKNIGCAITMEGTLPFGAGDNIRFVLLKDMPAWNIQIVWKRYGRESLPKRRFCEFITEYFSDKTVKNE